MRGPEAKIEDAVSKFAKELGWMAFKFSSPNHKGVPDRIFLRGGETFFIEFKAPGKQPTLLQKRIHKTLQDEKFDVYVVDDSEMGKQILLEKETNQL